MTKFNLNKLHEIAEPRKLTRAEEMALETYPRDEDRELNYRRANYRIAYERGYKQAEKDMKERFIQFVHMHYPINYTGWIQDFQRAMEDEK